MFEQFKSQMNEQEVREKLAAAAANSTGTQYKELPAGAYSAYIEKMEIGTTKDGRPKFSAQLRVLEPLDAGGKEFFASYGGTKKPCVFTNYTLYGTKNDMSMIAASERWVNSLELSEPVSFIGDYDDYARQIEGAMDEIRDAVTVDIEYDPDQFHRVVITGVFDK